jgi:hypothetical protein
MIIAVVYIEPRRADVPTEGAARAGIDKSVRIVAGLTCTPESMIALDVSARVV